jgi:hypothetical protein
MFCDTARVGAFAVDAADVRRGDGAALFRMLVVSAMFQRRQDQQILRILRGVPRAVAEELTDAPRLLALAASNPCEYGKSVEALRTACDLAKDPSTGQGVCGRRPDQPCALKEHTVTLKRYGHFGKMPTSVALAIHEEGARDLSDLVARIVRAGGTRRDRAVALEQALCAGWRVSQKIASMFLSAVTNPDLSPGCTVPWAERVDWRHFVVVDSNVDLLLASIGYTGLGTYDARRAFVQALAAQFDLRQFDRRLRAFNPRIVQQALYLFMSMANRRSLPEDCSWLGAAACARCPRALSARCGLKSNGRP